MATLRATVFSALQADTALRTLLGKTADPYGIYFLSPPKTLIFPLITIFENAASGDFPRIGSYSLTVWHGDRDAVLLQVYSTLHNHAFTTDDFGHVVFLFDWAGPDLLDDNFHVFFKQVRYLYRAVKK